MAVATLCAPALADEELTPTQQVELSARLGSFLPMTSSPATPASNIRLFGEHDTATQASRLTIDAQALFTSWLQVQAGASYEDEEVVSRIAVQLGILEDDKQGLDFQIAAGYSERSANDVPAVVAGVSIGHELPGTYVAGSARFALGTEQNERGLLLNAGIVHALSRSFYAGVDSELTLDLERDADEPMNESTWTLKAGPVVTYAANRVAVTAAAGLAIDSPRMAATETGMFAIAGIATAF